MRIAVNQSLGPTWVILDAEGREIACAHRWPDAQDFVDGRIGPEQLAARNALFERATVLG